ncbi:MAG: MBOAT family protein [Bacteroidales bacterium]|nr:MBOAT family protein [Bacteroidales bacterium]
MNNILDNLDLSKLGELLTYSPSHPLMFNSGLFLFLFLAFIIIYRLLYSNNMGRMVFVIIFSLYFYYKSSGIYVLCLLLVAMSDFLIGLLLQRTHSSSKRKWCVALSALINMGMLCYFKYTTLIVDTINTFISRPIELWDIALPIGISFFTFRSLSYIIDIYRGKLQPTSNLLEYIFFLSFFPPLVAGPVVRAIDLLPQIQRRPLVTREMFAEGLFLVMTGVFKKVVISDYISINFVDRIFDAPALYTGLENLLGIYGYTLQIYCDFSGYSDMAIGIALLLGFRFPINFDSPYKSGSITEFWRRWHITLSTWLRDYLYISLGGNRVPRWRNYFNLFITMVIGGLWHGASWLFVLWGAWHGLMLVLHKVYRKLVPAREHSGLKAQLLHIGNVLLTFHVVAIGWVFFRADSLTVVGEMATQIFTQFHPEVFAQFVSGYPFVTLAVVIGYLLHYTPHQLSLSIQQTLEHTPLVAKAIIFALFIFLVLQVRSSEVVPFIYLQF